MHTHELFHNEIYRQSNDDNSTVYPLGMLKDKLELLEVVEKKGVAADLLALKQQMDALQKQKDKKSVQLVSNPSSLGPELSGRRGLIAAKRAGILTAPMMKTKVNKRTKFSDSMPTSPALTATNSPVGKDVTSVPKPKSFRKDPLFLPLIHLLALGPEKEQVLAMKTHTDLEKCSSLVIRIANRDVSGRWDLFDHMYKDLDVWKFKYPKPEMRELAIENAEDAYDRLKLAEDAPQWEMLRKPEDRGTPRPPRQPRRKPEPEPPAKKKPAAAAATAATVAAASPALPPTIKVSRDESAAGSPALGSEPMARSISQPTGSTVKARGNAESNALKKIIGNSNKKGAAKGKAATIKGTTAKERKSVLTSTSTSTSTTPSFPSTATTTAAHNNTKQTPATAPSTSTATSTSISTTISQKSPNPPSSSAPSSTRAKAAPKPRTEFKSAEFILDSESDDDRMAIDTPPRKAPASSSSSSSGQPLYKTSKTKVKTPQTDTRSSNVASKRPPSGSVSVKREPSPTTNGHKRNVSLSASPAKPSPLGSSPPMTASDIARQSSTASSSPLSSIATPDDVSTPMMDMHTSYTSAPINTPKSMTEKAASKPRYIPEQQDSPSPPRKVKAEDTSMATGRNRKRILSTASEDSDATKKRKAPEEDRPVVARKAPKTSATSEATKARKEPAKTVANGVSKKDFEEVRQSRKDIPRATYASSTTSTASNASASSSDTSSRGGGYRQRYAKQEMELLAKYKRLHDDYRARYEKDEVSKEFNLPDLPSPPIFPNHQPILANSPPESATNSQQNATDTQDTAAIDAARLREQQLRDLANMFTPTPSPEPESRSRPIKTEASPSPSPSPSLPERTETTPEREERKRQDLINQLNFSPSPPLEDKQMPITHPAEAEVEEEEEEGVFRTPSPEETETTPERQERQRQELIDQLNFTPSPPPGDRPRTKPKEAPSTPEELAEWEEPPKPKPSALAKIIRQTKKHTKNWLQAQKILNRPAKPRVLKGKKPEPEKPDDGSFQYPESNGIMSWFSYNRDVHGKSDRLSAANFARPYVDNRATKNVMTKTSFPTARRC
ncbi:hypothetical protein ABW20_dc0106229 [Dactylellina cionopaga]|nr:hypothetical protein ABW20_dc0106229 [Dactylellina cionopaga]